MGLLDGWAERVAGAVPEPAAGFYECVDCLATYERAHTNCPDCDGLVVRVVEPDDGD